MQSTIRFLGGAGTVTGSNFLLETGGAKFLVDCGLFQGEHAIEDGNWEPFSFDPTSITALINTHAHIDHIGRIPKLVKDGFRGPIISTHATRALAEPLLYDAMHLSTVDALRRGKEPLYTEADIQQALSQWQVLGYHEPKNLADDIVLEFYNAGHILGSAMAKFSRGGAAAVFTGDLGGGNSPLLDLAEAVHDVQYVVMESVYGNRTREEGETREAALARIANETLARGGTLLIPAFSTERTQDLLFEIRALMLAGTIPSVPVYLDSPLAEKITDAYLAHPEYFSRAMQARIATGEKLFSFKELEYIEDSRESEALRAKHGPKILIAGSGMSNGGRVLAHEQEILPNANATVLIVGYQAAGSFGRRLIEGAKSIDMHGEKVPVRAHIETMYGYSAHMDSNQLLAWAESIAPRPKNIFVVMGEPAAASFLVQRMREYAALPASAPEGGDTATINL